MEDKDFESLENFANHPLVVHKKVFERVMRKYFTMKRVGPMLAEEDISDKAMEMVDKALEARTYYFGSYTSNKFAEVTMYNHFFADSELEEIDAELETYMQRWKETEFMKRFGSIASEFDFMIQLTHGVWDGDYAGNLDKEWDDVEGIGMIGHVFDVSGSLGKIILYQTSENMKEPYHKQGVNTVVIMPPEGEKYSWDFIDEQWTELSGEDMEGAVYAQHFWNEPTKDQRDSYESLSELITTADAIMFCGTKESFLQTDILESEPNKGFMIWGDKIGMKFLDNAVRQDFKKYFKRRKS